MNLSLNFGIILAVFSASVVHSSITFTSRRKPSQENFVPVEPIPGTNLYTGVYYKVGMERFPSGWITWTEKTHPSGGWHYLQIDSNPGDQSRYQKTGDWYTDIQWFFVPSIGEPGWYILRNRHLPDNILSVSRGEEVGGGHHIILNPHASPYSGDSLWKPVPAKGLDNSTQLFGLQIKSFASKAVTWTEREYGDKGSRKHFIQVDLISDSSRGPKYQPGGEWYMDTLFRMDPLELELNGRITQLQMKLNPNKFEQLQRFTKLSCQNADIFNFANLGSKDSLRTLNEEAVNKGQLNLKLDPLFSNAELIKLLPSKGQLTPLYGDQAEFQIEGGEALSAQPIEITTQETSSIAPRITVPAYTCSELQVCREFFDTTSSEEMSVGVSVFMQISADSERPLNAQGMWKAARGEMPAEFFRESLENLGSPVNCGIDCDSYNILPAGAQRMVMSNNNDPHLTDSEESFSVLGSQGETVYAKVNGWATGTFGYRALTIVVLTFC